MIKVIVKTSTTRKEVTAETSATPASVLGAGVAGAHVNLNGVILSATDLNSTFEALGVQDGSIVNLNSIVKADGANK